jgi:membrane-associated protease RseP (regulator of RpoE activity)
MNNLNIISAMLLSILWHEACHAFALLAVGVKVRVVQIGAPVVYRRGNLALGLFPFYGSVGADLTGVPRVSQAFYYVSGPIGSLLLGCLIYANTYFYQMLWVISFVIGLFNVLPIPPLDGYRLFTLVAKVPFRVQIIWAALGWMAIVGAMLLQR